MKLRFPGAVAALLAGLLAACAAPRTTVHAGEAAGTVLLRVAPSHAEVRVDGTHVGAARDFDGTSAVLKLPHGKHLILLRAEGYEDHTVRLFLGDTQERIEVNLRRK